MRLWNMRPRSSQDDGIYRAACNSELFGKVTLPLAFTAQFANLLNLFLRENGMGTRFAACLAFLAHHIGDIIASSTGPNMVRVNARRIIAFMAGEFAARKGLIVVELPRNATGDIGSAAKIDCAVAGFVDRPFPFPTIGEWSARAVCPKVIFDGVVPRGLQTMTIAISLKIAFGIRFFCATIAPAYSGRLTTPTLTDTVGREQAILGDPSGAILKIVGKVGRWGIIAHGIRTSIAATEMVVGTLARRFRYFLVAFYSSILARACCFCPYSCLTVEATP